MGGSFDLSKAGTAVKPATLTLPTVAAATPSAPANPAAPLVAPQPPAFLSDDQAIAAVKLERDAITRLDVMSAEFIVAIMTLDLRDQRFFERAADIRNLGTEAVQASAETTARLLDRPVGALVRGGPAASSTVGENLAAVRREADELNPSKQGDLANPRKLFGVIKTGDPLRMYFGRYESSQADINAVLLGLQVSQVDLRQDNTYLDRERQQVLQNIDLLRQYLYAAQRLESSLVDRVLKTAANDPERARFVKDDLLSNARQKVVDLTTHLGLSIADYMAIEAMERNNHELIRGLDRAKVAIISTLRTATVAAQTAIEYKLALDQITMLNDPTLGAVATAPRGKNAPVPPVTGPDLSLLQVAFANLYATLDEVDAWRAKSSAAMTKIAAGLQSYLDRGKPVSLRGRGAR